jgi:hypothetical protein
MRGLVAPLLESGLTGVIVAHIRVPCLSYQIVNGIQEGRECSLKLRFAITPAVQAVIEMQDAKPYLFQRRKLRDLMRQARITDRRG